MGRHRLISRRMMKLIYRPVYGDSVCTTFVQDSFSIVQIVLEIDHICSKEVVYLDTSELYVVFRMI